MYKYANPHSRPAIRRHKIGEVFYTISVAVSLPEGKREALEEGVQRAANRARRKAREQMGLPPTEEGLDVQ